MKKSIQGPGVFLAQFIDDAEPYNRIDSIAERFASWGYKGLQIPSWDRRVFDLDTAAESDNYCSDYKERIHTAGLEVIEIASYLQGQVMAIHPAYADLFQGFYPRGLNSRQQIEWATGQLRKTILASVRLGTNNISVLSGGLAWPYFYPWPPYSQQLLEEAFDELARRWIPLLNMAQDYGITFGFELHPGSDLHDGTTFLRFLDKTAQHPAACITYDPSHFLLQQMDYVEFIEIFFSRIVCFHVKDAEFNPSGHSGVYGGYNNWIERAGRFRTPGDGQVDFNRIFSTLCRLGYSGWAVLEWECCLKSPEQGAREAAGFIDRHIIRRAEKPFDDFVASPAAEKLNQRILGLITVPEDGKDN
jgi:sugar phosphate isomerase/epimerase